MRSVWWVLGAFLCGGCKLRFDHVDRDELVDSAADGAADTLPGDDAASPDGCLSQAAVFCDGFEGTLGAWDVASGATVTSSPVRSGGGALRAEIAGEPASSYVETVIAGIGAAPALYMRAWLYVPGGFTLGHINLFTIESSAGQGMSVYAFGGNIAVYQSTSVMTGFEGPALQRDQWLCVELSLDVGTNGGFDLSVAGASVLSRSALDTQAANGYDRIYAGISFSGPPQTVGAQLVVDDVVLDVAPIGCSP